MVDAYEGNAYLRLKANPKYWGGKPPFETVVFKFVPGCDEPRRRDRKRLLGRDPGSALRRVRPAQEQGLD
jgi:ABC-type transport system substrate-binding protein